MTGPMDIRNRITEVRRLRFGDVQAHPQNFRRHPKNQRDALAGVVAEVGFASVPLAYPSARNGGALTWLDGHLRSEAFPDYVGDVGILDVGDAEAALLLATLDPLAALATHDAAALDELLRDVQTGDAAVQELLANVAKDAGLYMDKKDVDAEPQIDRAEELRVKWGVSSGDLWALGDHRLICGDCTDAAVVARVMGGDRADACVTDPPYNVDKAVWDTDVLPLLRRAADVLPSALDDDGICFWFTATRYIPEVIAATEAIPYRWMFVWYPSNNMAHGDLGFQKFTAALVLSRAKVWRQNMQDLREVPIRITKEDPGHPTPKPIELIRYLVEMASKSIVFDGFLGSGTTLIACEQLGRKCRAVEISPGYVAVALERWAQATGRTPERIDAIG